MQPPRPPHPSLQSQEWKSLIITSSLNKRVLNRSITGTLKKPTGFRGKTSAPTDVEGPIYYPSLQLHCSLHLLVAFGSFLHFILWGEDAKAQMNQFILVAIQARLDEDVKQLAEERFGNDLVISSTWGLSSVPKQFTALFKLKQRDPNFSLFSMPVIKCQ